MSSSFQSNIGKLYLIKLSKWLMLIMPIVALFYNDNGLDNTSIYLLQAVYSFSLAVIEIPSGYMADIIGRKKALVMGSVLGTLGFIIYSFSTSFGSFMVAEIILGLGGSFISGSDSAILYDSLAADKQEHTYLRYEGRITSLGSFAETLAAIGGGLLAAYLGYRSVYVAQTVIAAIAIPAAILLKEPPRKKSLVRPGLQQILSVSYQALWADKKLSSVIWFSSIIGTATLCMAWTSQVYFVTEGLTEKAITPIWVILNLAAALVSAYAAKTQEALGKKFALLLIVLFIPTGFIFMGALPFLLVLPTLVIFYLIRGYATPYLRDLINKNCQSDTRATVLSVRSMVIRISFSILGPVIGHLDGIYSLATALIITGCCLLFISFFFYNFLLHTKAADF